jgi:hypothetical protein
MLRDLLDHPLLKQARAAGEEQLGRAIGQILSPSRAGATVQAMLAVAGEARERIDRGLRAALDAAQVPSTHDVDDLKRRLGEMEELLDGLAARLTRAETADEDHAPSGKPGKGHSRPGGAGHRSRGT